MGRAIPGRKERLMNGTHRDIPTGVMLKRIGAGALCAALVITFHLRADAASSTNGVQLNGAILPNGVHLNGGMLGNGVHLNGAILPNGRSVNGAILNNGRSLNGVHLNGVHLNGVHLNGAYIRQTNDSGVKVQPSVTVDRIDGSSIGPIEVPDDRQSGR